MSVAGIGAVAVDALSIVVLAHGVWWTLLCLVALPRQRHTASPKSFPSPRIVVVVPAHDEAAHIGACISSLKSSAGDGPHETLVVADNCTDETASIARDAGATVLERRDPARRGKSYALDFAVATLCSRDTQPDAVAFVDADSTVSESFFDAVAGAIAGGASVVQVHYQAARGTSALGRLRRLAFLLIHWSRPLGASRLGLGTSLKGNGMAMRWSVARSGLGGSGLAEDAAMSLALVRRGLTVRYESRATVTGFMAQDYAGAEVQDHRWERGRLELIPQAIGAAARAVARGNLPAASTAMEVASLPLSLLVGCSFVALIVAVPGPGSGGLALSAVGSLVLYVVSGLAAARVSFRQTMALATAPRFLLHKLHIYLRVAFARGQAGWERTGRG